MATETSVDPLLENVRIRKDDLMAAESQLELAVVRARQGNRSWERIATALGVKRQSAISKYAKACDE